MLLSQAISTYFNLSELHTLAFDFGIDWENVSGNTKNEKAIGIVNYFAQRNKLNALIGYLQSERPFIHWANLPLTKDI